MWIIKKETDLSPLVDILVPDFRLNSFTLSVIFGGVPYRNTIRLMHFVVILFLKFGVLNVSQSSHNEKESVNERTEVYLQCYAICRESASISIIPSQKLAT